MSTFGISHFIQSCNSGGRLSRLGSKSLFFCQTVFTPESRKRFAFAVGLMVYFRAFNVSVTCNPEASPVCGKGADHSTASQTQHASVMPCMALQEAVCTVHSAVPAQSCTSCKAQLQTKPLHVPLDFCCLHTRILIFPLNGDKYSLH